MVKPVIPVEPAIQPIGDAELYELVYQESPLAIITLGAQGELRAANRAAMHLLARGRSELIGTQLLEHVLPGDRAQAHLRLRPCFEGRVVDATTRFSRGDGVTRTVRLHLVPVVAGEIVRRVEVFLEDVTAAPYGLPDDPAFYRLLEQVPGQFALLLDANGRIRRSVGLAATHWLNDRDCLGRSYALLLAPDEANRRALEELQRAAASDEGWSGVVWHARADGARLPVRIFARAYRDPRTNQVKGTLLVGRDTSREQEMTDRVARLERLAAVGELVASIASELQRALDDESAGRARVPTLRSLLESLGAFATTYLANTGAATDVASIVSQLVKEYASAGARIRLELEANTPAIGADREHVRLAIRELLKNGLEAAGATGEVLVRVETAGPGVRVRVHDSGPGLDAITREHACDPFITTKPGHLGLGLAIARGIAALYGGHVQLTNGTARGAVVELELPPTRPDPSIIRPMQTLLARGRTVLVVDDDQSIRNLLRRVLERVGYRVQEAWSGRSALAAITDTVMPDIVLTDIKMGGGSGYWLLQQLRRYEPHLLERTIIVTGYTEDEQAAELALSTGCPVVAKPIDLHRLIGLINDVLLKSLR